MKQAVSKGLVVFHPPSRLFVFYYQGTCGRNNGQFCRYDRVIYLNNQRMVLYKEVNHGLGYEFDIGDKFYTHSIPTMMTEKKKIE